MKNNALTYGLLAVLGVSALWSVVSCTQYSNNMQEMRQLQNEVASIESRQTAFRSLLTDTVEYAKTHPKIEPLLESIGIKRNPPASPAAPKK